MTKMNNSLISSSVAASRIFIAYSRRFAEALAKRPPPLSFRERIAEWNRQRVWG